MKANDVEMPQLFLRAERMRMCAISSCERTRKILRRHVERGEVVRPARGMYARAAYWSGLSKPEKMLHVMRTAQSIHPDWVFCHESAAVAFGLPVSYERLGAIHVATTRSNRNANSKTVRWHVVAEDESVIVQGLRVTSLQRTVFDCMRMVDFGQALAVADFALRLGGGRASAFVSHVRRIGGNLEGAAHAMRTMHYADARSESGGESIARAAMIQHGFALPELQVALPRPLDRRRSYRVDFLWTRLDGSRVIGEFDGMQKYEDAALRGGRTPMRVLADEQHREAQLTLYGMPIMRFSSKDVANTGRFVKLLDQYGIPRDDETARVVRRLSRSRSTSAHVFAVCALHDEPFVA